MNSLLATGALVLLLGLLCVAFGVLLFRRGSGWGTDLLGVVPPALVVGGYLAYSGASAEPERTASVEPRNPVSPNSASIARGEALYAQHCVACHGGVGRGDGPEAATHNPRPPDMSQPHTAYHTNGYLFNAVTNGFPGTSMAAWGGTLGFNEGWDLVNYLRELKPFRPSGQPGLRGAAAVRRQRARASAADPPPRGVRGAAGHAATARYAGVRGAVRRAGRHRGDDRAGRPVLRPAPR